MISHREYIDALYDAFNRAQKAGPRVLLRGTPSSPFAEVARHIRRSLPPLNQDERAFLTATYRWAKIIQDESELVTNRPLRAPHFSVSQDSLCGSTKYAGELTLASFGVLLLDSLIEFRLDAIRLLADRIPRQKYPPIIVGSAHPCPCGWYGRTEIHPCTCEQSRITAHHERTLRFIDALQIKETIDVPPRSREAALRVACP